LLYIIQVTRKTKIAVLGYGSQGRAWALNLKDSGHDIIIGLRPGSKSRKVARREGFRQLAALPNTVASAQVIVFAFPDHLHSKVFDKDIRPHLQPGSTLIFLHGLSIHFKTVIPPRNCDIILLAPLGPGNAVREKYLSNEPIGFFYAIHQDYSGKAKATVNTFVRALKIDRKALIKTSFAEEAIGDIFGEQAVLCGGLSQLIKAGYDTLVESGLSPDKAYLEVAYQIDLIVELIKKYGIEGMLRRVSVTARLGSILAGPRIIDRGVKTRMRRLLGEIQGGKFVRTLDSLEPARLKRLDRRLKDLSSPSFEKSARKFSSQKKKK